LLKEIEKLARYNQIIYTTHLPFMINRNHPERIIFLNKKNGITFLKEPRKEGVFDDVLLANILGFNFSSISNFGEVNLFVEGITDKILIEQLVINYSWCKNCKKEYDNKHNERKRLEKYDMTSKEYEKMRIKQDNKCAISGIDFDDLSKIKKYIVPRTGKPRIDHDHRSGKVRGLLCSDCNIVLGCFMDNPLIILKTVNYLREHKK